MLIMARQEHVHIVSAGDSIYESYAETVRNNKDITHTFVFADTDLYTNSPSDDEGTKAYKTSARDAVTKVKSLSASLKIPASLVYVDPPADVSTRNAVLKIKKEHPGAKFSFNLTSGSKDLTMALIAVSLWLEGDVFYSYRERKGRGADVKIPMPKMLAGNMMANPNYITILSLLYRTPGNRERSPRVLSRQYIFSQLESFYVPVRKKGVKVDLNKTGKTDVFTGKKAVIPILSQGTFSNILAIMMAQDLIREVPSQDNNRKERCHSITPSGELVLQLAEIKPRKP